MKRSNQNGVTGSRNSRRSFLRQALAVPTSPFWASLATGLPLSWIQGDRRAYGAENPDAQFLVMSLSGAGDPLNANAPGSYGVDGVENTETAPLAPTMGTFGDGQVMAAKPWTEMPAWIRSRAAFIHHRTYTNIHPNFFKVLGLFGGAKNAGGNGEEMLPSVYSNELVGGVQSVQPEPVVLGKIGTRMTYEGRVQPFIQPSSMAPILIGGATETLRNLDRLRESRLDQINQLLKTNGTPAQKDFLDRYANSRTQLKDVRDRVGALVSADEEWTNDEAGQIKAAVVAVQLKLAPVIAIRIGFGGDNHGDQGLQKETADTVAGVGHITALMTAFKDAGLEDKVSFVSMNTFGRTLKKVREGNGRNHNQHHHVTVAIGKKFKGGVYGGLEPLGEDFAATGIDPQTGASSMGGIEAGRTLEATTVTVGEGLGISRDRLAVRIPDGQRIDAALV